LESGKVEEASVIGDEYLEEQGSGVDGIDCDGRAKAGADGADERGR
jgi:hypothetical protein